MNASVALPTAGLNLLSFCLKMFDEATACERNWDQLVRLVTSTAREAAQQKELRYTHVIALSLRDSGIIPPLCYSHLGNTTIAHAVNESTFSEEASSLCAWMGLVIDVWGPPGPGHRKALLLIVIIGDLLSFLSLVLHRLP